ncbi:MAG TPA: hypothetical protein VIL98_08445 [Gaiellaceae bacterium]
MLKLTSRSRVLLAACGFALAAASPAAADGWLPHPADATWTYQWTDSAYNTTPTSEKVTVKDTKGQAFQLAWTTVDQGNADGAPTSVGVVYLSDTQGGIVNVDPGWASNAAPPSFPILCASLSQCGNSLASTWYQLIWGTRAPVLAEPLLAGTTWSTAGGAANDVSSASDYAGTESITVPAFDGPVVASKIRTEITQAGAIGDPYGSGIRTVWWVYGVGPVKVVFEHSGGTGAPVTTSVLQSTNQIPKPPPADVDYFPLALTVKGVYRWTNARHLKKPQVESFTVDQVSNGSARISVKYVSGPIKVAAAYGFTRRLDGVTNIWGVSKSASLAKLPKLGPASLPEAKRRHFTTPFDLMTYGFNPLIPAYPAQAATWAGGSDSGRDYSIYGVTGNATVLGVRKVTVPAGTFSALVVRTTLSQPGFPFGSGTRTSWFAPKRGLVRLEFRHADGSVSLVELLR